MVLSSTSYGERLTGGQKVLSIRCVSTFDADIDIDLALDARRSTEHSPRSISSTTLLIRTALCLRRRLVKSVSPIKDGFR